MALSLSSEEIEILFTGFVDEDQVKKLADGVHNADPHIVTDLETALPELARRYERLAERGDSGNPAFHERYAKLSRALGDFYWRLRRTEIAHNHYHQVWGAILRTQAGDCEKRADRVVREFPALLRRGDVAEHYQQNPEIARQYGFMAPLKTT
ncbi:MAG: hypothetical protein Q8R04_06845 [Nanoarchaeota archaeon]|nr:hypothetical protein [Nanoarchaeota archaeon]